MTEDEDELLIEENGGPDPDDTTVREIARRVLEVDSGWESPDAAIELGRIAWRPDLKSKKGKKLLHVHVTREFRSHLLRRFEAAVNAGYHIHVVLDIADLYRAEIVRQLAAIDAFVHVVDAVSFAKPGHVLAVLGDLGVPVEPSLRTEIARDTWGRIDEGGIWARGNRFEALLVFLLGQVVDFRVVSRNYRTDTEEIDILLQVDNFSPRCWHETGVPFLLVEAKNWDEDVPQKEVTVFIGKILTKRGRVRIGLLFAAKGFTGDADLQETKLGQKEQIVVALIGPDKLLEWIDHRDADEYLEMLVRDAMLR